MACWTSLYTVFMVHSPWMTKLSLYDISMHFTAHTQVQYSGKLGRYSMHELSMWNTPHYLHSFPNFPLSQNDKIFSHHLHYSLRYKYFPFFLIWSLHPLSWVTNCIPIIEWKVHLHLQYQTFLGTFVINICLSNSPPPHSHIQPLPPSYSP